MTDPRSTIGFLADCHEADSRESAIADLFHVRVRHRRFLTGRDELVDGTLGRLAVDPTWGAAVQKDALLFKRERSLIYVPFLLVGATVRIHGYERALCAPVAFYPLQIESEMMGGEETFFAVPDLTDARYNVPVLNALMGNEGGEAGRLAALLGQLPEAPFDAASRHDLASRLQEAMPGLDAQPLHLLTDFMSERALRQRQAAGRKEPRLQCIPCAVFALVDNPPETAGVLFELEALTDPERTPGLSPPLQACLGSSPANGEDRPTDAGRVPAILSRAQMQILRTASHAPLSLVIGPPGTGKSFTAAALALDHVHRGGTVLFASRTQQALDVVADKIESMLETRGVVVRGGRHEHLRQLKDFLEQLLRGVIPLPECSQAELRQAQRRLRQQDRRLIRLERGLRSQMAAETALGEALATPPTSLLHRFSAGARRAYWQARLCLSPRLWERVAAYQSLLQERVALLARLLKMRLRLRLERALATHRSDLKHFLQALRARASARQERLFAEVDMELLLSTFPIWMASLTGVHRVLPLTSELFDVAIIDEATQCDMASCLPVLQRARRAVVTGDPKQLRHVSFLAGRRQCGIAARHGLTDIDLAAFDYRAKSLLDRVEDTIEASDQVVFLDEHFRSRPPIIAFSNAHFYAGAIKIMTGVPGRDEAGAVQLKRVSGCRQASGANPQEAEAVLEALAARLSVAADTPRVRTYGVLSPFREQVECLRRLVSQRIPTAAIERHAIRIGTAYGFQGEERDVMFLSLAVDADANAATLRYLNRADVFNVAITRARDEQIIFTSLDPSAAPAGSLLQAYLQAIMDHEAGAPAGAGYEGDAFLLAVEARLRAAGFAVYAAYPLAGLCVDLMITRQNTALAIDLIGHPGRFAPAFPLERYRMLHRAGVDVFPLPFAAWQQDAAACMQAIDHRCQALHAAGVGRQAT